jgi:hypothetical protein
MYLCCAIIGVHLGNITEEEIQGVLESAGSLAKDFLKLGADNKITAL